MVRRLVEGYKKFKARYFEDSTFFDALQKGQKPNTLVIACCDSRVDPAIVMDCKPGELFVVRNVANLVPPYKEDPRHCATCAALEYGVLTLEVRNIILFGHTHCGGVRALMEASEGVNTSEFIDAWMDVAKPAKQRVLKRHPQCSLDEQAHHCEKESLLISLDNLSSFPWIRERVSEGELFLHAWCFDISTGVIEAYQPDTKDFVPL